MDTFNAVGKEMERIKSQTDGSRDAVRHQMRREYHTNEVLQQMPMVMIENAILMWLDAPETH